MRLKMVAAPASSPVSFEDVKLYLRVTHTEEDSLIESLIAAATDEAQKIMNRQLIQADYEYYAYTDGVLRIPRPPLVSISTVHSVDSYGIETLVDAADYSIDTHSDPAKLTTTVTGTVKVSYTTGYVNVAAVPDAIKLWIKVMVGFMYESREEDKPKPKYIDGLLSSYRVIPV